MTSFRATTGRQQNIASDGQFIYTSIYSKAPGNNPPVNSMFYKYDFDGNLIEEFDITGCDHLRDLAYDGQYFYGGSAADGHESRLYCVDLANKTVIGYVTTPLESIRHCSYDPANDLVQVKSKEKVDSYELYNMTGALIRRREVNATSFEIDLHGLSAGAYLLKTRSESMTQTQRLVKQ